MDEIKKLEEFIIAYYNDSKYEEVIKLCLIILEKDIDNPIWIKYLDLSKKELEWNNFWDEFFDWDTLIDLLPDINFDKIFNWFWYIFEKSKDVTNDIIDTSWDIIISTSKASWDSLLSIWDFTISIAKGTADFISDIDISI